MTKNARNVTQSVESNPAALLDLTSLNHQPCLHILHVDDDTFFSDTSKNILEMDGKFEVDIAASVDEALSKMKSKQFDAVVSDYEMPLKNGLQFLRELREQKNDVAFIMFTGRSREEVVVEALNLGADRFISKCGDPETVYFELAHAINTVVERKKAKKLLTESESKYRTLVENPLQGIAIAQGIPLPRIVFANKALGEILGYSTEELTSLSPQGVAQLIFKEDREVFFSRMKDRLTGVKAEDPLDFRAVRKDGSIIWFQVLSNCITFRGQPAVQGMFLNTTARVEAERKLRQSEEKYKELINAMNDTAWVINLDANFVEVNDAAVKVLGYSREELLSMGPCDIDDSLSKEQIKELVRRMPADQVQVFETSHTTKDGRKIPVEISSSLMTYQGKQVVLSIARDITERKTMEQRLKEEHDKLEIVTTNIGAGLALISKDYRVLWSNGLLKKMFGENIEHKTCFNRLYNRNDVCPDCGVKKIFDGAETDVREYSGTDSSGKPFVLQIVATPVKDENGRVFAALELAVPITERKQMEIKLREAESRYRAIFNNAPLGVVIVDQETKRMVEFNDITHKQLGYSRQEFARLTLPDLEVVETEEKVEAHIAKILKEGGDQFETKHRKKDGEIRNVMVTARVTELDKKAFIHCIFEDITEDKKVQDALMKSESKYRQLVELAQEGVWAFDNNFVTVFVNPRMVQMLGYQEGEMVGKSVFEFVDKDDVEAAKNYLMQSKQGVKGQFEYAFPRKDGTHVYTSIVASNITDDQGGLIGTLALVADITERKQTEEALKESEERSRAIVANSPIGIATSGSDKRFLSANDAFCRILGYTEVELRKLTFKDVTRPEDLKESLMKMEELNSGKISSFTLEKRYVKKDGSIIFGKIMVSAIRDETGNPNLFIAELEDITERKKKEHELKEERNKLEAITQSIGAGFGIMSKDYHVLWVNKFIKEYKGDVEGKLCYATLNDLDHVCPDCGVKKVFENGVSYDAHEYKSVDIKGNPYWVELIATPIKDENGKVLSAIEIAIDITEKKNLQSKLAEYSMNLEKLVGERTEELKQTQAKLVKSERLAAIGELAAMIGHDLRNPLAGMKNAVYYLNKHFSTESNDTERKMFQVVNDCIDHSNKIINDLLEYSRNVKLEISETTPKELLRQAMLNLEIPKTIQVADLTLNETAILVDVPKMVRVFVNLLKNAFDAMPDGGSMRIVSRTEPMEVEIEFSDTGMGMSQETLNRLWTPLFTTKAKGMGFGLAICKRFVEAHGGRIIVASQEGKGTTFIIKIPRKLCPTEA